MKHKHYECIVAFAEGKKIQYKLPSDIQWLDCHNTPMWYLDIEYRIKPKSKPDIVKYVIADVEDESYIVTKDKWECDNLKLIFDGETGKLKSAEVIK